MDALPSDLRFALRAIRRRPAFALTAILSLSVIPMALGTVALGAMLAPLRALARNSPMSRLRED